MNVKKVLYYGTTVLLLIYIFVFFPLLHVINNARIDKLQSMDSNNTYIRYSVLMDGRLNVVSYILVIVSLMIRIMITLYDKKHEKEIKTTIIYIIDIIVYFILLIITIFTTFIGHV